jgi:hypothetical protein
VLYTEVEKRGLTTMYAAPERLSFRSFGGTPSRATQAADLYSLALVFRRMLTQELLEIIGCNPDNEDLQAIDLPQ